MFAYCSSLSNINLSNFNTQNVTDMSWMFYGCKSLINLDLSNFNTQNVTKMSKMFIGCDNLSISNLICYDEKILKNKSESQQFPTEIVKKKKNSMVLRKN